MSLQLHLNLLAKLGGRQLPSCWNLIEKVADTLHNFASSWYLHLQPRYFITNKICYRMVDKPKRINFPHLYFQFCEIQKSRSTQHKSEKHAKWNRKHQNFTIISYEHILFPIALKTVAIAQLTQRPLLSPNAKKNEFQYFIIFL